MSNGLSSSFLQKTELVLLMANDNPTTKQVIRVLLDEIYRLKGLLK